MKEQFTEGNSEDDWARLFYESSDLAKTLSWEEFEKKGYHIIPCPGPEEYKSAPGLRWYAEGRADDTADTGNPKRGTDKANELGTYTGKIEFASESLRQNMPDDKERPVVPHWIPSWEGYKTGPYEKYPLQIICRTRVSASTPTTTTTLRGSTRYRCTACRRTAITGGRRAFIPTTPRRASVKRRRHRRALQRSRFGALHRRSHLARCPGRDA